MAFRNSAFRNSAKFRNRRLIAAGFAIVFASVLSGCSSVPSYDPTDIFDLLDTKKRAPGERKPVFPEGVPGITPGVPREMIKGQSDAAAAPGAAPVEAAPAPEPPPAANRRSRSGGARAARSRPSQVEIAPDDVNVQQSVPAR